MNNKLRVYARRMEIGCKVLLPAVLILFVAKWFQTNIPFLNTIDFSVAYGFDENFFFSKLRSMTFFQRFLGMLIDSVSVGIISYGLYYFIKILQHIKSGMLFSAYVIDLFNKISKLALFWAVYAPISHTLTHLIVTMNNAPGHKELRVGFGSGDVINIFMYGLFLLLSIIMKEAYRLQQDQKLTV